MLVINLTDSEYEAIRLAIEKGAQLNLGLDITTKQVMIYISSSVAP